MTPGDARRFAPSAARNREPILAVLERVLPPAGVVLEVASGTGEHARFFAARLPAVIWQPSDRDAENRASIGAWRAEPPLLPNLAEPVDLDVTAALWPVERADAVVAINLIHIAPWAACRGLLAGAARVLPPGGALVLYGAFQIDGRHTAPSNEEFDRSLRARDPAWGVRDLGEVRREAESRSPPLAWAETVPMPSNNFCVVFRRARMTAAE